VPVSLTYPIKKALLSPRPKGTKKRFSHQTGSVLMTTFTIGCRQNRLDNAERHAGPQNGKRIPQAPHKNYVGHIPYPLKVKWKHCLASLKPV
jgi:hypothetical protein